MNRAWIELDRKALSFNLKLYEAMLPSGCEVMAVLKANAYGHGAVPFAIELQKEGISHFAVAALSEAVELRECGITGEILILGYTDAKEIPTLIELGITTTVTSYEHACQIRDAMLCCGGGSSKLRVHIAIDTGMHRIGIPFERIDQIENIYRFGSFSVDGIYSHLCVADSDDKEQVDFSLMQIDRFFKVVDVLRGDGISVRGTHILNSYAIPNYKVKKADYARLGLLLCGVRSAEGDYLRGNPDMKPVLSLRAHITNVCDIQKGETVGYGRTFKANRSTKLAAVAIGYADGIPRNLGGRKLRALVHGVSVSVLGRICMDQLMLDVTGIDNIHVGDIATFIGCDGDECIKAEEIAFNSGTITNEFLSRLGRRLENIGFIE